MGRRRKRGDATELTAREQEVFALIRDGQTNNQIAERLEITLETAKHHVSEILSKLNVPTREAAAEWTREKHGWWERLGALGLIAKVALSAGAVATLVGLGILAWATASGDWGSDFEESAAIAPGQVVFALGDNQVTIVNPRTEEIVRTIATGSDPEFTISPDGGTLYVTALDTSGIFSLSLFDTRDGHLIKKLPAPDRITNIGVGSSAMSISADGRYLYIHKWKVLSGQFDEGNGGTAPNSDHWWDIFDTTTQEFLPDPPHVANCGIGRAFPPTSASSHLGILCYELNSLVFIDPKTGSIVSSIFPRSAPVDDVCSSSEQDLADAAQAPDGTIYVVTLGGCVLSVDPKGMMVTNVFKENLPEGWRVPYNMVALSPNGDHLFLAGC